MTEAIDQDRDRDEDPSEPPQPDRGWKRWCAAGLVFASATFILLKECQTEGPARMTASLMGFTNAATGVLQPVFQISNDGPVPLRRWDFAEIESRGGPASFELHIGPDGYLNPGQSELVTFPLGAAQVGTQWHARFYYTRHDWRQEFGEVLERRQWLRHLLPESMRGSIVDGSISTDWLPAPRTKSEDSK